MSWFNLRTITQQTLILYSVLLLFSPSAGQFVRQHIRRGEPGRSRWTGPQVQGQRQDIHARQRRSPPFCLPQSHPRVQGRGQNHLNSSPTTAAALFFYPPPPLSTTTTPLLHPSRQPSLAFFTLFSGFYSLSAFQLGPPGPLRHTQIHTHSHKLGVLSSVFVFMIATWLFFSPSYQTVSNKNNLKEQFTCFFFTALSLFLGFFQRRQI